MKSLIYIFLFLSTLAFGQIQQGNGGILPIEDYFTKSAIAGEKNGLYFKDVNGLFDAYTGVWQWVSGNQELTFYLYKDEKVLVTYPFNGNSSAIQYEVDLIYGYYVYRENGAILIDTKPVLVSNLDDRQYESRGGCGMIPTSTGYDANTAPRFFFNDYSRRVCIDGEEHPVKASPGYWRFENATTAKVGLYTSGNIYTNCPIQILHPNFPNNNGVTLTRIATQAPPL